ncbi:hypothetical protein V8C35DRAFT_279609 [Trichoderma chlorosporum]
MATEKRVWNGNPGEDAPMSKMLEVPASNDGNPASLLTDQVGKETSGDAGNRDVSEASSSLDAAPGKNGKKNPEAEDQNGNESRSETSNDISMADDDDSTSIVSDDTAFYKDSKWLEPINKFSVSKEAKANPERVGSCSGVLIRRDQIRSVFHKLIEEQAGEVSALGLGLFDRYGRLKPAFKRGSSRSGSGFWADELDSGDILLVNQVHIDKNHRRQGLGRELVGAILQEALGKSSEEQNAIYAQEMRTAEYFWRSHGFRRIGHTEWFAFILSRDDINTPPASNSLSIDEDFNPPEPTPAFTTNPVLALLLKAFETIRGDADRLGLIQTALGTSAPNGDVWVSTDRDGNTLLHHVATSENPTCVKWIVKKCPRLCTIRNRLGETPLESCQEHLEDIRTKERLTIKKNPILEQFSGYRQPALDILCTLQGLSNPSPEELQRLKYGCSCGQCQEGFLSPRMHRALLRSVESILDVLSEHIPDLDGDAFVKENERQLEHLQPAALENMRKNKIMRQGFGNIFEHFAQRLKDHTEPPYLKKILEMVWFTEELPPVTKTYLELGGTLWAVGSAVFMTAMDESRWAGDGSILDDREAGITTLPACRNDDEFGFVSGMCGYDHVRPIDDLLGSDDE